MEKIRKWVNELGWVKYVILTVVFVVLYVATPIIMSLFLLVMNFFTPKYFQSGYLWICIFSDVVAAVFVCGTVAAILDELCALVPILCLVAGAYSVSVGVSNSINWGYAPDETIGFIIGGVVYFVIGVMLTVVWKKKE